MSDQACSPRPAGTDMLNVLIADHPDADQSALLSCLKGCGLTLGLQRCSRPSDLLDHIDDGAYDVILMDRFFVGAQTLEEFSSLLQRPCSERPPILVTTDKEDQASAVEAIACGAQGYLSVGQLTPATLRASLELAFAHADHSRAASSQQQNLWHQSLHDGLTGLANRHLFTDRVSQELRTAKRAEATFAIINLDLDRFRLINENCGQLVGDQVLSEVASRISATVRRSDTVARLGGDQFSVLLPAIGGPLQATRVAEKLRRALIKPYTVEGYLADPGVSLGIALYPQHGAAAAVLIRRAEVAMFDAKRRGGGVFIYAPAGQGRRQSQSALERDLDLALNGQLQPPQMIVQPRTCLASGACLGGTVGMRWIHHEQGVVSTQAVFRVAERAQLTEALTMRLLDHTLEHLQNEGAGGPKLTLKLSPQVLTRPAIVDAVGNRLADCNLDPGRLLLEFDETAAIHHGGAANPVLRRLAGLGMGISISGVGGALSSFSFLRDFPLTQMKIHRGFVGRMVTHKPDAVVVGSLIHLAECLGVTAVAEGVGDDVTRSRLQALGCVSGEGPGVAREMPLAEFCKWRQAAPNLPLRQPLDRRAN